MNYSSGIQLLIDAIWSICNAFHASKSMCYLYLPVLLLFIYINSNLSMSCKGKILLPKCITNIFMLYCLIFALYFYIISDIGHREKLDNIFYHVFIAPNNLDWTCIILNVLFAFLSVHLIIALKIDICNPKPMPMHCFLNKCFSMFSIYCRFSLWLFLSKLFVHFMDDFSIYCSIFTFSKVKKILFSIFSNYFHFNFCNHNFNIIFND